MEGNRVSHVKTKSRVLVVEGTNGTNGEGWAKWMGRTGERINKTLCLKVP